MNFLSETGSPLKSYAEELAPLQLQALRLACLLAAPILVVFSVLDFHLARPAWLGLLALRLGVAALLLLVGQIARSGKGSALRLSCIAGALVALPVEAGAFATGGAQSPYLYSMMIVLAALAILLPLRPPEAAILCGEIVAITVLPFLFATRRPGDELALAIAGSYLVTAAVVSVAGSAIQDRLRRGEHLARHEFARHAGLLNLGALAGGLAHELANPLGALFMQAELLGLDGPSELPERVAGLRRSLERMKSILEAMKRGARIAGGERRKVLLEAELEVAITLAEGRLRNRVEVRRDYARVAPLDCQPTLLGQVLVNLVINAADAVKGRPDALVFLRLREEDDRAVIEVEDNGPGVPAELRLRIFEPFFTTKGESGNGLGLWISSEIARLHGGSLTVVAGQGPGACFRLELPFTVA